MEGKEAEVQVYSDADEVELLLNGRSLGRKPAGEGAGYTAVFQVAYEPGELTAIARHEGRESSRWSLFSGKGSTSLLIEKEPAGTGSGNADGICYYKIRCCYENGVPDALCRARIKISVENGELLGFGSADPTSGDPFDGTECSLFHGEAQAVICSDGNESVTAHLL